MEKSLSGILLLTEAEDKEGSGRFESGSKMVMTSVPCTHYLVAKSHGLCTGKGINPVRP